MEKPKSDPLTFAYDYAAKQHRNQRRKNNEKTPYINHPIDVANILSEAGITDINIKCAGILHDTIEDTGTQYEDLVKLFGTNIADMVDECTDDKKKHKIERKKLQIEHAKEVSLGAAYVKMADKISNLSGLHDDPPVSWTDEEVVGYAVWCYAVVQNLRENIRKKTGSTNEYMDNRLAYIFSHFELTHFNIQTNRYEFDTDCTTKEFQNRLEIYYGNIHNSE